MYEVFLMLYFYCWNILNFPDLMLLSLNQTYLLFIQYTNNLIIQHKKTTCQEKKDSGSRFIKSSRSWKKLYDQTYDFTENCDLRLMTNNALKIGTGYKQSIICNFGIVRRCITFFLFVYLVMNIWLIDVRCYLLTVILS